MSGKPSVDITILLTSFKVGEAERVMSEAAASLEVCHTFPGTKNGIPVTFTLQSSTTSPSMGDQSVHVRVVSVSAAENLVTTYLFVRAGNTIVRFMSAGPTLDGIPSVVDFPAREQVEKLMDIR
ncbi:hypothetical protein EHYA_03826 [Embleya hyalina]|uniref:Uncharacterized protein n=1 Tax=Embleya hyalina TaxID=516124 RepID=A0A401YNF3_9ACTN|nr:hypothetical protein EHYA_03826 [Embleya hyalina]